MSCKKITHVSKSKTYFRVYCSKYNDIEKVFFIEKTKLIPGYLFNFSPFIYIIYNEDGKVVEFCDQYANYRIIQKQQSNLESVITSVGYQEKINIIQKDTNKITQQKFNKYRWMIYYTQFYKKYKNIIDGKQKMAKTFLQNSYQNSL